MFAARGRSGVDRWKSLVFGPRVGYRGGPAVDACQSMRYAYGKANAIGSFFAAGQLYRANTIGTSGRNRPLVPR